MRCLVVTSKSPVFAEYSYYQDWLAGFVDHPGLQADILDIQSSKSMLRGFSLLGRYDLIAFLHNTFPTLRGSPRLQILRAMLSKVRGPRVFFLNNEFRALDMKARMAEYLGARTLISQLNDDDAQALYASLWTHRILSLPYGFDPQTFKPIIASTEREIDIGFRGDYYPAYVGHDDRDLLLNEFDEKAKESRTLKTDIQVGQRLDRLGWAAFLNNCRGLIGHEAGSMRLEADENIRHFLNAQVERLSPENYRALVLSMRQTGVFDPPPSGRIAAPRNFEAMGTKTVQILLPGRYNDMLEAGVHYIELQRDFSNIDSALDTLFDESAYTRIAERAHADALAHHTYEQRINTLMGHML
jgi:hypothetical protein